MMLCDEPTGRFVRAVALEAAVSIELRIIMMSMYSGIPIGLHQKDANGDACDRMGQFREVCNILCL